jgi:hypothetical protein
VRDRAEQTRKRTGVIRASSAGRIALASRWSGAPTRPLALAASLAAAIAMMLFAASAALAAPPTATINPTVTTTYTTAQVSGEVDGGEAQIGVYCEWRVAGSSGSWNELLLENRPPNSGVAPVAAKITGLTPGATYEFRLDAYSSDYHVSEEPNPVATTTTAAPPVVSIEEPTGETTDGVHLAGQVTPGSPEPEGSTDPEEQAVFEAHWQFVCEPACPGLSGTLPAGNAARLVEADASGLSPGETYKVKLVAKINGAEAETVQNTFTTLAAAPTVSSPSATGASGTIATLHAAINPGGAPATYFFEYLTKGQYEAQGSSFSGPDTSSTPATSLGFSDDESHEVSASIHGLEPGATYYFRATATNSSPGSPTVRSQAKTFIAYGGGTAETQSCPNETLRSENNSLSLPDCRAYEQVTPPYKEAHEIFIGSGAIAPSGLSVLSPSPGAFAGTPDDPHGPGSVTGAADYQFHRTTNGWVTTPLNPPANAVLSNGGTLLSNGGTLSALLPTVNADALAFSLSERELQTNLQAEELYVREPDGSLIKLGPLLYQESPEVANGNGRSKMLEASADDSRIFFRVENALWPGDTTLNERVSLYEANGSSEPKLVAITNTGLLHSNSEAQLIGQCGSSLAGYETKQSGISSAGDIVYFEVGPPTEGLLPSERFCTGTGPSAKELYARVDGEKTVAISSPVLPPAEVCTGVCAAAEPEAATFQGASEDGRKVFFTTDQPLLNADHDKTSDLYEETIVGEGTAAKVGSLTLVSSGGAGDASPGEGAMTLGTVGYHSGNRSLVYFGAEGVLTSMPNSEGALPRKGEQNLYVANTATGTTEFIATLSPDDRRVFEGISGAQTSLSNRYLTFLSKAPLTRDDTSPGLRQVFEYDSQTGSLVRVSRGAEGYNDDGNAAAGEASYALRVGEGRPASVIADDGTVFFQSPVALTPGASSDPQNLLQNIYEYEAGRVYLIAPGVGLNGEGNVPNESSTVLWGTDPTGEDVFFATPAQLTSTDVDGRPDLYDARVHGGFPMPAVAANCAASASCQGSASSPPGFSPPATATFSGPVNKKPRASKKKHHKKKHHKQKHGASSKQRRAGK